MVEKNLKQTGRNCESGYTLIELLIVLAIVSLLVSIVLPQYRYAQTKAREAVLRENLQRMREVIDQYYQDKGKYPESLETLVTEGYFRRMPIDPVTGSDQTWQIIYDDPGTNPDPTITLGIQDVKSGAQGVTLDGTPYADL
ncbi:MAG TPA: prepilin-type N-terminal cleavage/methylation domain-containing protein [Acidobacteriota bacterium]|nr:prepilin-type N-terminal cleavage/methylation domain-containing protein [Acidobacteriota bacterium]